MTPSLPDRLTASLARLSASVDHLEGAASRRTEADSEPAYLALQSEHARLGAELAEAISRGRVLLDANAAVSARLDRATATVRAVLADFEPADDGEPDADEVEPARRAGGGRGE